MSTGFHPLSIPLPPLQRVGLFAAASVRALADFAALNEAARECVTQMGVRDRALPGALRAEAARGADRAAIKRAWECESLADALVPAAQQLGIDAAAQVELLIAFRDVGNVPASWSLAKPLAQWAGVTLSARGSVSEIDLHDTQLTGHVDLTQLPARLPELYLQQNQLTGPVDLTKLPASLTQIYLHENQLTGAVDLTQLPARLTQLSLGKNQLTGAVDLTKLPASLRLLALHENQLTGAVDLTKLPATLTQLTLGNNQLAGAVDLTKLPASLTYLWLEHNAGLTGVWRGTKPSGFFFEGTEITAPSRAVSTSRAQASRQVPRER
jgi:hypothetical protein